MEDAPARFVRKLHMVTVCQCVGVTVYMACRECNNTTWHLDTRSISFLDGHEESSHAAAIH
jgi:hypothetical protein